MSGENLTELFTDLFEGTRTFESGIPINLEGYWVGTIHLPGTTAATAANYNTAVICPYTSARIDNVWCVFSGAGGSSAATQVERIQGTEANGAGDDLLTTAFDLTATANTVQAGSLIAATATRTLSQGDRLGLVDSGTLTGADDLVITFRAKILTF